MSWINQHQNDWRIALIVVMVVAFMGPWAFERINVPAEYACSAPYIRLEGDFCGSPLLGIQLLTWISSGFISISFGLLAGEFVLFERIREILISLLMFAPLLPIFSTLLLILRGDHPRRQVFTIIAWVLAIGGGLFIGWTNSKLFWRVWGIWLYIVLATSALILEIFIIISNRNDPGILADGKAAQGLRGTR